MSETILKLFVYLFLAVSGVAIIHVFMAWIQLIEDHPAIRKKIWLLHNQRFTKTHKS